MFTILSVGVLIGTAATIAMDFWALLLNRLFAMPMPNWGAVGRWVWHLKSGRVFHDDIATANPAPAETAIGWAFHYGVGIAYGIAFLLIAGPQWRAEPTLLPAWVFAIATIAFGWFLLQPGLGIGWAAAKTPTPWKARALGLVAHTIFGLGLWGAALILSLSI